MNARWYKSVFQPATIIQINLEGLSLDAVYENFVRQIAGDVLARGEDGESLKDSVKRDEEIQVLKKQIEKLQIKIRKEKQLNIQIQLNAELKLLKQKYNGLTRI